MGTDHATIDRDGTGMEAEEFHRLAHRLKVALMEINSNNPKKRDDINGAIWKVFDPNIDPVLTTRAE